MTCRRCASRGIESPVSALLTIATAYDQTPAENQIFSQHDPFTSELCMACVSDAVRLMQRFESGADLQRDDERASASLDERP